MNTSGLTECRVCAICGRGDLGAKESTVGFRWQLRALGYTIGDKAHPSCVRKAQRKFNQQVKNETRI